MQILIAWPLCSKSVIPVEQTMQVFSNIGEIRSFSRFDLSPVAIVTNEHIDIHGQQQQKKERSSLSPKQISWMKWHTGNGTCKYRPGRNLPVHNSSKAKLWKEVWYNELRTIQDGILKRQLLSTHGNALILMRKKFYLWIDYVPLSNINWMSANSILII